MLSLLAVLILARLLSARAQRRGYPGYVAALGVFGWVAGEATLTFLGADLGAVGVLLCDIAGGAIGGVAAFVLVQLLPDRSANPRIDDIEDVFQ